MALVTFEHLFRLEYCVPSIRTWCREHRIPIRQFRKTAGVPSEQMRATGCPFAVRAAELAEREAGEGGA